MSTIHCLMQLGLMRSRLRSEGKLDPSFDKRVDRVLVHDGPFAAYEMVRPVWEQATK